MRSFFFNNDSNLSLFDFLLHIFTELFEQNVFSAPVSHFRVVVNYKLSVSGFSGSSFMCVYRDEDELLNEFLERAVDKILSEFDDICVERVECFRVWL